MLFQMQAEWLVEVYFELNCHCFGDYWLSFWENSLASNVQIGSTNSIMPHFRLKFVSWVYPKFTWSKITTGSRQNRHPRSIELHSRTILVNIERKNYIIQNPFPLLTRVKLQLTAKIKLKHMNGGRINAQNSCQKGACSEN
jgi:hypothetical protein